MIWDLHHVDIEGSGILGSYAENVVAAFFRNVGIC